MTTRKPTEMSNDELLKNEKTAKIGFTLSLVAVLLMLATGIYLTLTDKKFSTMIAIGTSLSVIAIVNGKNLKALQQEKKIRNL
ncbi:hypothetical protein [Chitinophaga agri]|uniref:Redox-active disulfide protein 2 n=1 Tax=Chitinophaga agri TaxID=2703787 RepID=A0A6B9ZN86_9BACT|nr:hypothetical protein [Chitinophaga agri]QHS63752.1 hypothetical protein GWR21_30480 [Chitinophaga agri]